MGNCCMMREDCTADVKATPYVHNSTLTTLEVSMNPRSTNTSLSDDATDSR
jgi:hypothetical protein